MRLDPGGDFDDRKLAGLGWFGTSEKLFDWIADRLAKGAARNFAWGSTVSPWLRHRVYLGFDPVRQK
jgi:hypothetical protein